MTSEDATTGRKRASPSPPRGQSGRSKPAPPGGPQSSADGARGADAVDVAVTALGGPRAPGVTASHRSSRRRAGHQRQACASDRAPNATVPRSWLGTVPRAFAPSSRTAPPRRPRSSPCLGTIALVHEPPTQRLPEAGAHRGHRDLRHGRHRRHRPQHRIGHGLPRLAALPRPGHPGPRRHRGVAGVDPSLVGRRHRLPGAGPRRLRLPHPARHPLDRGGLGGRPRASSASRPTWARSPST